MFAITTIVVGGDASYDVFDGALHRLPPELMTPSLVKDYVRKLKLGWSVEEFGYQIYRRTDGQITFVVPGLIILGRPKPKKKFGEYKVEFGEKQIESYVDGLVKNIEAERLKAEQDINLLVHDLRQLSGTIYHAAEEGIEALRTNDSSTARVRFENIIASQTMLRIRADALDFTGNPNVSLDKIAVPIFRRVDKVVRSFMPYALKKRLAIRLEGRSFRETTGPDVFEIIPFTLIDNAVKYSPPNSEIRVRVTDFFNETEVIVQSMGPRIESTELRKIFERGYRGVHAKISGRPGSGIGLHMAANLVSQFSGQLTVEVGNTNYTIGGVNMADITFKLRVPSFE